MRQVDDQPEEEQDSFWESGGGMFITVGIIFAMSAVLSLTFATWLGLTLVSVPAVGLLFELKVTRRRERALKSITKKVKQIESTPAFTNEAQSLLLSIEQLPRWSWNNTGGYNLIKYEWGKLKKKALEQGLSFDPALPLASKGVQPNSLPRSTTINPDVSLDLPVVTSQCPARNEQSATLNGSTS